MPEELFLDFIDSQNSSEPSSFDRNRLCEPFEGDEVRRVDGIRQGELLTWRHVDWRRILVD